MWRDISLTSANINFCTILCFVLKQHSVESDEFNAEFQTLISIWHFRLSTLILVFVSNQVYVTFTHITYNVGRTRAASMLAPVIKSQRQQDEDHTPDTQWPAPASTTGGGVEKKDTGPHPHLGCFPLSILCHAVHLPPMSLAPPLGGSCYFWCTGHTWLTPATPGRLPEPLKARNKTLITEDLPGCQGVDSFTVDFNCGRSPSTHSHHTCPHFLTILPVSV